MDTATKQDFLKKWKKYFGSGAELPVALYYTDDTAVAEAPKISSGHRCLMADIARVRNGEKLRFGLQSIGCQGGQRYLGFTRNLSANFAYFLSCGIPGELEGERYKKSPELVKEYQANSVDFTAPSTFAVFKRWDNLEPHDEPEVIIFFAEPDVLSGLFTLANYDRADANGVYSPFSAGCGSIVKYPFLEKDSQEPRAVLGMFDVSARPLVPASTLTFAVPAVRFFAMVKNMDESFLITHSWKAVRRRIP